MSSSAKPTEPEGAFEPLAEEFFSSPPPAEVFVEAEAWDQPAMSAGNRRAMQATIALLGCGAAALLGFAALSEWVMVAPVQLGGVASQASLSSWTAPVDTQAMRGPAPAASEPIAQPAEGPVELVSAVAQPAARRARSARIERASRRGAAGSTDEALTRRAYSALASGRASEAEQLAKRALASNGTRAATYIVLAGARDALGNREGARAAFRDCVQRARDAQVSTCRTLAR